MRDIQHIQAVINAFDYDFQRFELSGFIRHIEQRRKHPIILRAFDFSGRIFGLWLPTATADFIGYKAGLHQTHETHVILHEIGHILLGHQPTTDLLTILNLDQLLASGLIRQPTPNQVIARTQSIYNDQEHECELFAGLINRQTVEKSKPITSSSITDVSLYSDIFRPLR